MTTTKKTFIEISKEMRENYPEQVIKMIERNNASLISREEKIKMKAEKKISNYYSKGVVIGDSMEDSFRTKAIKRYNNNCILISNVTSFTNKRFSYLIQKTDENNIKFCPVLLGKDNTFSRNQMLRLAKNSKSVNSQGKAVGEVERGLNEFIHNLLSGKNWTEFNEYLDSFKKKDGTMLFPITKVEDLDKNKSEYKNLHSAMAQCK